MSSNISKIMFSILVIILQVLLFNNISIPVTERYKILFFIYPVIILYLPFGISYLATLSIAFILGFGLDIANNSLGVNAGALVFMGYMRPYIIKILEPIDGYKAQSEPTLASQGFGWFLKYAGILLWIHIISFFTLEYFSYVFIVDILIQSSIAFLASISIIILLSSLFRR